MSTSPSATPLSSHLTLPATQNTAPVIKFRCLYTYDLRRKAKRWQDGFLKFHTFNKRIMVYDTPGNFIGDLHWRQDNEIQDGDELELDKGVLIEVCERMEKTETDLSKLFEKKKSVQGSPRPGQPLSQSPRPSTPLQSSIASQSQNPQRSLSDLLGIKRTPIGRLVSPYEARHPPTQRSPAQKGQNLSERPTKRQRVLPLEERRQEQRVQAPNRSQPVVIDLVESSIPPEAPPARQLPSESLQRQESRTDSAPERPRNQSESISTPRALVQPKRVEKPHNSADISVPSIPRAPQSNSTPNASVNTLRLSNEKPRRKLMYQALLPPQTSTKPSNTEGLAKRATPQAPTGNRPQSIETGPPNHLLTGTEFAPSASTQVALDEIIDVDQQPPPALNHSASSGPLLQRKPPQKSLGFRKSLSDPSALTAVAGIHSRRISGRSSLGTVVGDEQVHDQGPWTSEALDLFDFWPPGRPKPG